MSKIEVSIPRDDEKRFCDLLHLNGFTTEVDRPDGRPVVIRVCIRDEQFEAARLDVPLGGYRQAC